VVGVPAAGAVQHRALVGVGRQVTDLFVAESKVVDAENAGILDQSGDLKSPRIGVDGVGVVGDPARHRKRVPIAAAFLTGTGEPTVRARRVEQVVGRALAAPGQGAQPDEGGVSQGSSPP